NIEWTSSGVNDVKIEFTTDNGQSWTQIVQSTPSDGFYQWNPVANVTSTSCKIRISDATDGSPYGLSAGLFTIVPPAAVTVTSPNGGEYWEVGSTYEITWVAENLANVQIDYSVNNGSTWTSITASTANTGNYSWTVPLGLNSTQSKIRVSDPADGQPFDISDNVFTLSSVPQQSITVTAPNGGEVWGSGTSQNITWTSSGVANVKIEYSTNNGQSWTTIIASTLSDGFYQWNPLPSITSTNFKVRISDDTDGFPFDLSDNVFTIAPVADVTVTAPNGGELWTTGTTQNITWIAENLENVKLEFTTNNGSSWSTIIATTPNVGTYLWTIPNLNSNLCRVRVSDPDDGQPFDLSDSAFIISNQVQQSLTVLSPNGGEDWEATTTQTIEWLSSAVNNVKIEYTTNNGIDWTTIVASTPSDGLHEWSPAQPSALYKIRISDAADGFPMDESDAVFTVSLAKELSITYPNGGEVLTAGEVYNILWTSQGITHVMIEYKTVNEPGDSGWTSITNRTPSDGSYAWGPTVPSTTYRLRMRNADASSPMDESDGLFKVDPQPVITVIAPNGGDTIQAGLSYNILWSSVSVENVKIEVSTNNGANWQVIIASTESDGIYTWSVPGTINSSLCKIRISDTDGSPSDVSDNAFVIYNVIPQSIAVVQPNGGENLPVGTSYNITWISTGIDSVKIEYSTNNGLNWTTVVSSTLSDGFYQWNPVPAVVSTNCRIRISETSDGFPYDLSDNVFTIASEPDITVQSPNGGEVWTYGSTQSIRWLAENVEKVKVEFTTNNGATWSTIVDSTDNTGSYLWTIPNLNSSLCKVRISDARDGLPFDLSDNVFSLSNQVQQSVNLTSPNGGEIWEATSSRTITWVSSAISKVKIEFTTNNGISWTTIVDSTESDGLYEWNPVPNTPSGLCKVRISDYLDSIPNDESDAVFTISQARSLQVIYPNGGERLISGTVYNVLWNSQGVTNVKIEYRLSNASEWIEIISSTPSDGSYEWSPSIPSTQYKMRISDAGSTVPIDESDGTFTVEDEPSITIITPNGGDTLQASTMHEIRWTSNGLSAVKIEFTTNNGSSWTTIVDSTESDGSYLWSVANVNSSLCKLRISDEADGLPSDISDNPFTIYNVTPQQINVVRPAGGENFPIGSSQEIIWSSQGVTNVMIELSTNSGLNWTTIVASTPSDGSYLWAPVPNSYSTNCRIRISDAADTTPFAVSPANFTISAEPALAVIAPNGFENWISGTSQQIRWSSTNVAYVKLEFSSNNGATWSSITDSTPSTGIYTWSNIPVANSDLCRVRVSDGVDGIPFDVSDTTFSVVQSKALRMVFPNGPTVTPTGTILCNVTTDTTIIWYSVGVTTVNLELTLDNGATGWTSIAAGIPSTGAYYWTIPASFSSLARVRVTDATDPTLTDMSDGVFNLGFTPPGAFININGGTSLEAGTANEIQMIVPEDFLSSFLEFSEDDGVTWKLIERLEYRLPGIHIYDWEKPQELKDRQLILRLRSATTEKSFVSEAFSVK
ncbi:MAG: hypothetical protein HUU54_17030, partial [Ignavibacteriaceae bacterium]|nr:hypothetical protein [Ignavibacteriaceae bacterium]